VAIATKSSTLGRQFESLVALSVLLSLTVYAAALAALFKRSASAGEVPDTFYKGSALLGILFCVYVIGSSPHYMLWMLTALMIVIMALYALTMRARLRAISG
jgi:hypothetical protein